jgi:enediyne biosynthesis protein E4
MQYFRYVYYLLIANYLILHIGCNNKEKELKTETNEYKVFTLLNKEETGISFTNLLKEEEDSNILFFDYYYNGGGLAVGDLNGDNLPDLYFTANTGPNKLYYNQGNLKFEEAQQASGVHSNLWSTGAVIVDINNDGLPDIYVCNGGPTKNKKELKNHMYLNNGDGTFTNRAEEMGIAGSHRSTMAVFFDANNNGLLDLYVINYADMVFRISDEDKNPTFYDKSSYYDNSSMFYKNNGDGTFTESTEEAGLLKPSFGLGVIASDFNGDGLVDLYVSNDYLVPNFLFINNGDGTFRDQIKDRLYHCSHFSMGVDFADINNDGLMDIMEVDMMPEDHYLSKTFMRPMNAKLFFDVVALGVIPQFMFNSLHIQHGFGIYSNIAQMAGVGKTDWSWAPLIADYNNNGWKDILVTNGFRRNLKNNDHIEQNQDKLLNWARNGQLDSAFQFLMEYPGYPLVNYLFKNNKDLTFTNASQEWGINIPTYSNGAAFADLDGDGDLELIINNIDQPAFLYKNNTSENTDHQWIRFKLTQDKGKKIAYNAQVEITLENGRILLEELKTTRGFQSSVEPILHLGLGSNPKIQAIKIYWPDQKVSEHNKLSFNTLHSIDYDEAKPQLSGVRHLPKYGIRDYSQNIFKEIFIHQNTDYNDFEKEILLPYKQSTLGPLLSGGDANGNGMEDFYIGGGKGQSGRLYLIDEKRGFYAAPCQPWQQSLDSEDMGSVFFDADGDGDLDLYVVSGGGSNFQEGEESLQDRLYLNDGNGCMRGPIANAVPDTRTSGGRVIAGDLNGDGLEDLFVCGRTKPGAYPFPGTSYLLINEGGIFKDMTAQWNPALKNLGMVTDAIFFDFNGDGQLDLLLAGEWMSLKLFIQEEGKLMDRTEEYGLSERVGWWYSLELADVNMDGKMDIIAGNLGKNNKFKFSPSNPLHIYAGDLDNNGTLDIVLSNQYKGQLVPLRGRQCSSEQMPFIKSKFPTFEGFATASLQEIYGKEPLENALHYVANETRSMVWLNEGSSFKPIPLPNEAQMSPGLQIVALDANKDDYIDLLLVGDIADTEPETPAFDGGCGRLLTGNGDGTFTPVWMKESGLWIISKNTKDLLKLKAPNRPGHLLLIGGNGSQLQALHFEGKIR